MQCRCSDCCSLNCYLAIYYYCSKVQLLLLRNLIHQKSKMAAKESFRLSVYTGWEHGCVDGQHHARTLLCKLQAQVCW